MANCGVEVLLIFYFQAEWRVKFSEKWAMGQRNHVNVLEMLTVVEIVNVIQFQKCKYHILSRELKRRKNENNNSISYLRLFE